MSQNTFKRFKPNPSVESKNNVQEQRFKRAHESDGEDGSGSKRRFNQHQGHWQVHHQQQEHWQVHQQQQPSFYQPQQPAKSQNEVESLLTEW